MGTDTNSAPNLVAIMHSWVARGTASISIASSRIHLNPACSTLLDTLKSPDCRGTGPTRGPPAKPTGSSLPRVAPFVGGASAGEIGGIIVGVVIAILLLILVVLIAVVIYWKWKPSLLNRSAKKNKMIELLAHSLYTCIKLYINNCAVMTIETNIIGHVAAQRGRLKH